jgi:hypothetical protein
MHPSSNSADRVMKQSDKIQYFQIALSPYNKTQKNETERILITYLFFRTE